jgi:hypothetical protein
MVYLINYFNDYKFKRIIISRKIWIITILLKIQLDLIYKKYLISCVMLHLLNKIF